MTFSSSGIEILQQILAEAAALEVLPRFRKIAPAEFREKSSVLDLVTEADEQAEWRIRDAVAKAFPKALFVGEESVARDKSVLRKIADADLSIVIDPIDGTSNFAWGLPLFGMLCAVVAKGETIAGLIYDPILGEWFMAEKGSGAFASSPGVNRRLQVKVPAALPDMMGVSAWYLMEEPARSRIVLQLAKTKASFAYRCAAYEYRLLCDGHIHFAHFHQLMPWDHAAGMLIHAEAGGFAARHDGAAYSATNSTGGAIAAPDRQSWAALNRALVLETEHV
jgi:fructose-1,6-bisphosphatase/inositol monophosphatase family enzyme